MEKHARTGTEPLRGKRPQGARLRLGERARTGTGPLRGKRPQGAHLRVAVIVRP